jgi:hypothetical protein
MAGFLKRVQPYLSQSDDYHHHSQRQGNKYNKNPTLHPISPAREALRSVRGQAKRSAPCDRLRCRFDVCDVDSLVRLVQRSRNLYLLPGELRGLFLVAQ